MNDDYNIHDHAQGTESCVGCNADHFEYRLVRGTSYEGLSIRAIYFDKSNKVIGWDKVPLSPPAGTLKETITYILEIIKSMDDMIEGAKKPVVDEAALEAEFNK